jgi:hypothetical protein
MLAHGRFGLVWFDSGTERLMIQRAVLLLPPSLSLGPHTPAARAHLRLAVEQRVERAHQRELLRVVLDAEIEDALEDGREGERLGLALFGGGGLEVPGAAQGSVVAAWLVWGEMPQACRDINPFGAGRTLATSDGSPCLCAMSATCLEAAVAMSNTLSGMKEPSVSGWLHVVVDWPLRRCQVRPCLSAFTTSSPM